MIVISVLFFALMYAIKGGFLDSRLPTITNTTLASLTSGKVLSAAGTFLFSLLCTASLPAALFTSLAWAIGVAPSMGEEAGAVGRYGHAWGPYVDNKVFGRSYGVKKSIQRGITLTAPFAIITGSPFFLLFGLLFPVCHYVGQNAHYMIHRVDSWYYAEWLVGGLCIGLPLAIFGASYVATY